ncbi:lactate utilization protein B [Pyrobaculum sp.]|uniref:lactate utilization protein B n=1 Tax=Pyrobaculum sp. TaxID=2004705 RepID=UPI0031636C55
MDKNSAAASWEVAVERARRHIVPRTYQVLSQFSYVTNLAREVRKAKEEVVRNLDHYIEEVRKAVERIGGRFVLASTAEEAVEAAVKIVGQGKVVVLSKNNVATETGLRRRLEEAGNEVWETDLGEFLIQLAGDEPSHILAPAVHMTKERVAEVLAERLGMAVPPEPEAIAQRAREFLRNKFIKADVGITGANAIAADTGAVVLVENEGNIRLTSGLPPVHIVYDGVEKIVPTLVDAMVAAAVQSAYAGLYPPTYINISAGPSSTADVEMHRVSPAQGPKEFYMILVDNGRRAVARDPVLWEALLCIRCGRCHLHCPVYRALGREFGVPPYTGPMGVMWTAVTRGIEEAGPHALKCVHAGNCKEVCPMGIDIPGVIHEVKKRYLSPTGSK